MFERFNRSWELVKASWAVLRSDKELIVYPIVSFIGSILVLITFAIPLFAAGLFDSMSSSGRGEDGIGIVTLIVAFLFYMVLYTVIFFANTALVGAAMIRLKGGDPTLKDGFNIAYARIGKILGYALISATVGMVLRAISERSGLIGRFVIGLVGFAWSVATFMVVPVLVNEDVGPVDAVKRSASLLKQTWGEQIAANFGLGAVFGLLSFGIMAISVVLIILFASIKASALIILTMVVMVVATIALGLVSSALTGIYQAALYRYATEGETGGFFAPELIEQAFAPQKRGIFG